MKMLKEDIRKIIKEFKREVKKLYGKKLKGIVLYGSYVRGEAVDESDIDLMVVLKGKVKPGKDIDRMINIITEINLKYGVLLSVYPYFGKRLFDDQNPFAYECAERGNNNMKEINLLLKKAKRYLKSAEVLIKEGDYESSVSRTYYAMSYSAQAVLLTKNLSFSSHKGVISAFGEHFIKTGIFPKDMGRELNRAFEKRQIGDYGYSFVISKREAKEIFKKGIIFVEKNN